MAGQDGSNAGAGFVGTLPLNVMYIRYFLAWHCHWEICRIQIYIYMNLWLAGLALALGRLRSSLNLTALIFHANSRGLTGSREAWRHPEVWDCQVPGEESEPWLHRGDRWLRENAGGPHLQPRCPKKKRKRKRHMMADGSGWQCKHFRIYNIGHTLHHQNRVFVSCLWHDSSWSSTFKVGLRH